ncbi:hypothetical protein SH1V18_15720 [Vallitalea longa]|uniref:Uncharacterized protein n=1 Tax=Vallitalea longa TaxID=2936439 RepID=A0A9W5Y8F5_9FIRM|nr:BatD family protein [Vallitalea longa]GKX29092.1 hypothetical protein SH1V18_15720 [Vallitalea longa]
MTGKRLKARITFILCLVFTLLIVSEGSALAKEAEFRLDMDTLNLEKGVSTNLVFSIINANDCKNLKIDGLENFDVLSSGQKQSTKIINGDKTTQIDINYVIMPKKTGDFSLQGSVEYEGNAEKTNILNVNVSESSTATDSNAQDIFVKTVLAEDEIYLGQKVALTYELYSRYSIESYSFTDPISLDEFIINEEQEDQIKANYVYINGNKYVKYEAKKIYMTPIKPGEFTIPSYNFQVGVSTRDVFSSAKPYYFETDEKQLTIKPLPEDNKPADFSGLVGNLEIESDYSKNQVEYGDSLTLNVTASGNCNLELLNKIIKDELPGFSVYETVKDTKESVVNNKYNAEKKFEIILVPEKNGDLEIKPINISYFDTETETYKNAEIPGTTIKVTGEVPVDKKDKSTNNEPAAIEKVTIDQVNYNTQDTGYITLRLNKNNLLIGLIVLIILVGLVVLLLCMRAHSKKQDKNLHNIYKRLKNTNDENELYNLFNDMIKYRYDISLKASSKDSVKSIIKEHDIADIVIEVINYMENKNNGAKRDHAYLKDKIKEIYSKIK